MKKIFIFSLFIIVIPSVYCGDIEDRKKLFNEFVSLLKQEDVLRIPKIAREYHANKWDIQVHIENVTDHKNRVPKEQEDHWEDYVKTLLVINKIRALSTDYNFFLNSTQLRVQKGHQEIANIQKYFFDELVQPRYKETIKKMLEDTGGSCISLPLLYSQWSLFTVYDIDGEIYGETILTIAPEELDQMILIHISYVHS